MSNRNENLTLIEQLRDYEARLLRLETQNNKTRKNDIRLSDTVVTADSQNDQLCLENLVTHKVVCIGDNNCEGGIGQAWWTFDGLTELSRSPYLVDQECVAIQLCAAKTWSQLVTGTAVFCVRFKHETISIPVVLTGADEFVLLDINVPLNLNDDIIVDTSGDMDVGVPNNILSLLVRFGTPTVPLSTNVGCEL